MKLHYLPMRWRKARLGECCEIVSGATPSRDIPEYWGGSINWVTPKDLSKLEKPVIDEAPEKITEAGYRSCSSTLMPKGAVLFSSRAPIGLVAIAGQPMCTNQGFKSVVPGSEVVSEYLYWCLRWLAPEIAKQGAGTTFKEIAKPIMENIEIPLPPLDEQRRIAAILDKTDAVRRKRQESIRLMEEFLRSTFLEMFGDPVTNPKGWEIEPLEKLVNFTTGKLDSNAAVSGGAYPFFTCAREDFQIDTYAFDCEALLLAGNNASADYSVKHYKGKFNAYQRTYVITMARQDLTYRYMQYALEMKLQDMKRLSKGTNTKYLTLGILNQLQFQVPDKDLQVKFESIKDSLTSHIVKQNESLVLVNDTFESCVHRAFRGEL